MRGICFFGGFVTWYPRSTVLRKGLAKLGLPVRSCRASPKRRLPTRYAELLFKYLRSGRDFSVIYVPEFRHKDVPLAWMLGKLTRKLVVFDPLVSRYDTKVRDRADAKERSLQAWHNKNIDRLSFSLPDVVLADTKAHADYYISELGASADKMHVLPVGFDEALFALPSGSAPGEDEQVREKTRFKVLFYGSYLPLHGASTIVKAAKKLQSHRGIDFELIGGGQTYPEVEEFVAGERLNNVRLLSRVPLEMLPGRIHSASICLGVFGETEKALRVVPNKVYQCMGMGKTVITARSEAILERFSDGETICLVPPGDPDALAEKIAFLASHPEECARIGARAYRLLHEEYRSEHIARRFLDCCGQAIKRT